jgi:hypothetical protein
MTSASKQNLSGLPLTGRERRIQAIFGYSGVRGLALGCSHSILFSDTKSGETEIITSLGENP